MKVIQILPELESGGVELLLEPAEEGAKAKARAARETLVRCVTHSCMQTRAFCVSGNAVSLTENTFYRGHIL